MKKLFALVLLVSSFAFANTEGKSNVSYSMAGLEGGFKWSSAEVAGASSNKSVIGYQLGVTGVFDFSGMFGIKTGLMYNERPFESTLPSGASVKGKLTYFDVPALLMFKFEEYAGIYAGTAFSFKLGDELEGGGSITGIKSAVTPLIVGAQFKFAPNLGVDVYFETISGNLANSIEGSRAVGANLLLTFD